MHVYDLSKLDHAETDLHHIVQVTARELLSGVPRADGGEKKGSQVGMTAA
jgi:hypothetical protein